MAALPYFPFYPNDYLADTRHLTLEEHGAYVLLILNYWQTGRPLRTDDERMSNIVSTTVENWRKIKPILAEFFTETTENGADITVWKHERVEKELHKAQSLCKKASRAGKISALQRAEKKKKSNDRTNDRTNHTDTDTDTDKRKDTTTRQNCPYQKIVDLYHEILPELPQCKVLTTARRGAIRQRHRQDMECSLDTWRDYFEAVSGSPFLMGKMPPSPGRSKPFIASLDWLTKQENYAKIFEGKYHG